MAGHPGAIQIPDMIMLAGLIDIMLYVDDGASRKRDWADVAAGVPVRIRSPSSLALGAIERHAPDSEVDPEAEFRTVIAVHHRRAVGRGPRIEGPVVSVDDLGVVLSQALDHMTVEVEQIEIARLH